MRMHIAGQAERSIQHMTTIEWTHRQDTKPRSWNMIGGCSKVSPGCDHCYALRDSYRIANNPNHPARYEHICRKIDGELYWTGLVIGDWDALEKPLHWQKPSTVFVASMADLFHKHVPDEFILEALTVMLRTPRHTYQILTKRSRRMYRFFQRYTLDGRYFVTDSASFRCHPWPQEHIWLGVTAENQKMFNRRARDLVHTPTAIRYLSLEPLLGPIDLSSYLGGLSFCHTCGGTGCAIGGTDCPACLGQGEVRSPALIDWVIVGGESGPHARPMELAWARSITEQCQQAGVPVFVKQLGSHWARQSDGSSEPGRKGENMEAWPGDLQIRQFPDAPRGA